MKDIKDTIKELRKQDDITHYYKYEGKWHEVSTAPVIKDKDEARKIIDTFNNGVIIPLKHTNDNERTS